jgi:pseudouridine synthase
MCGVASRRGADELIAEGRVKVNGEYVDEMGKMVDVEKDVVMVNEKIVKFETSKEYYMVYKPEGYVSTVEDEHAEKKVVDLVKSSSRLYPVGRLDKDSEGLMILTNDGDLAYKLTHPKNEVPKTYLVTVRAKITDPKLKMLREGIIIEGERSAPCEVRLISRTEDGGVLEFVLHEGKKRQIRKMCAEVHFFVIKLIRIKIGKLSLGTLKVGQSRKLTESEIGLFS